MTQKRFNLFTGKTCILETPAGINRYDELMQLQDNILSMVRLSNTPNGKGKILRNDVSTLIREIDCFIRDLEIILTQEE